MVLKKDIHQFQNRVFDVVIYISYALYIAVALGLSASAPQYLDELQHYMKLYVSLFLIYRFNPFRRVKFTELDAKIAYNAGWFLLATTFVDGILKTYLESIKRKLHFLQ